MGTQRSSYMEAFPSHEHLYSLEFQEKVVQKILRVMLHMQKFPKSILHSQWVISSRTSYFLGTKTQQSFLISLVQQHSSFCYLNKLQGRGIHQQTLASLIISLQLVSVGPCRAHSCRLPFHTTLHPDKQKPWAVAGHHNSKRERASQPFETINYIQIIHTAEIDATSFWMLWALLV